MEISVKDIFSILFCFFFKLFLWKQWNYIFLIYCIPIWRQMKFYANEQQFHSISGHTLINILFRLSKHSVNLTRDMSINRRLQENEWFLTLTQPCRYTDKQSSQLKVQRLIMFAIVYIPIPWFIRHLHDFSFTRFLKLHISKHFWIPNFW